MHLAPTASRRVYQQRIGRIMRIHPRKEAGVVVDFVPKASTHNERVVSLAPARRGLLPGGARVAGPRRRQQRRTRRKLSPVPWLVPVTPDVARRLERHPARVAANRPEVPRRGRAAVLGDDRRPPDRFDQRGEFARKFAEGRATKAALKQFLSTCAAENPNRRRMTALLDRVAPVERADFDDLVTLVTQAPPWEKDRAAGVRVLLRAIGEGKPAAPEQILARWTWRLARAAGCGTGGLDRVPRGEAPPRRRRGLAWPPARGEREPPRPGGELDASRGRLRAARFRGRLHAACDAALDRAREELGTIEDITDALADNLPAPKLTARKSRRGSGSGRSRPSRAASSRAAGGSEVRSLPRTGLTPSEPAAAEDAA